MTPRIARWTAWFLVAAYIVLAGTGLVLQGLSRAPYTQTGLPVLIFLDSLIGVWVFTGALIISRHPRHPVGWLLCAGLFIPSIDTFAAGYAAYDTYGMPGSLPGVNLALIWLKLVQLGPHGPALFTLLLLLFPDGRFLSPGWRRIAWMTGVALLLFLPLQAVEPGAVDPAFLPARTNPLGISALTWAFLQPFLWLSFSILPLAYGAAYVSLFVRLRQSRGDVRQQILWLLFPAGLFGICLLLFLIGLAAAEEAIVGLAVAVGQLAIAGIVIGVAFAIFKYRLYDIDLIINRTLVYGALTACVIGLYVPVVGGAGLVIQANVHLAGLLITAAAAGALFRPLRTALQRGVDHWITGDARTLSASPEAARPGPTTPKTQPPPAGTPPIPRWMPAARAGWYPAAALAVSTFLVSIPGYFILAADGVSDLRFSANPSPLATILNWIAILGAAGTGLLSLLLAVLLFRRGSAEPMAVLTSFFLLFYGVVMAGPVEALEPFWPGSAAFNMQVLLPLFIPFTLWLFAVFPDGRFVPGWTRLIVLAAFLFTPLGYFWAGRAAQSPLDFSSRPVLILTGASIALAAIFWGTTLYAQIDRYRWVATPLQKQQLKWVIFGLGIWFTTQLISSVPWVYSYSLPPGTPFPLWLAAAGPLWAVSIAAIPITLVMAVLRYRLFQVDFLINRSLLYGALTLIVIAFYVLIVGTLGAFFQTQGSLIIALLATGVVAVLFQPLRARLQRGVNRLIFGERDDPLEALARLGRRFEASVPPDQVLPILVETIAQTLKLPYVAIVLRPRDERDTVASIGRPAAEPLRLPLIHQGEEIGRLLVGRRRPGAEFSPLEMRLLRSIARQAGTAVHAAQLTVDLQRSRQRLVTAREEERRRLRRDLHDGLGATLAALNLEAGILRRAIRRDPVEAESRVDELRRDIRATIDDIRDLVYELRPPTLDQLGLVEAVRAQAAQSSRSDRPEDSIFQVQVEAPAVLPPLPAAVEVAAFRIVQEALTNVVHHARARCCTVRLALKDALEIEVVDDGVGPGNGRPVAPGLGLLTMRERAEELGGTCRIEPAAGGGTRVLASLPLLEV